MDVLGLWRKLEVNKLHILLATQAKVIHEGLQESLSHAVAPRERSADHCIEDFRLFHTTSDPEELEQGMKILDIVDTGHNTVSKGTEYPRIPTYIGVPVSTHLD